MVGEVESLECAVILSVMEDIDESQEQWQRLRTRLAARSHEKRFCAADLCRAYEEQTGTWIGCD
jgi:hypothetical protein